MTGQIFFVVFVVIAFLAVAYRVNGLEDRIAKLENR